MRQNTSAGGVSKFDGNYWVTYTTANGLANNNVSSVAIDSANNKWFGFGGNGSGVSKFDGNYWVTYTTANGLASNCVYLIACDSAGNKWFGFRDSGSGVSKLDGTNWTTYTTANGLASNSVYSIAIDSQGNKWFGTSGGVSKFDGTYWVTYTTANGLANNNVSSIAIDSAGNKWFGTAGGVSKFDGTNWITYTTANGLASNYVSSIAIDSAGNKWFGSAYSYPGGGMSKFDGTNWTTYTTANGLVGNYIYSITVDSTGNKWFGFGDYGIGVMMLSSDNVWNVAPVLSPTGEKGYELDGLNIETGDTATTFIFRVKYTDADGDKPKTGYPKLHIKKSGSEILYSPFTISYITGDNYLTGLIFSYYTTLSTGTNYTYYFEVYDIYGATATGTLASPIDAPDVSIATGQTGTPILSVTPNTLDFGELKIGDSKILVLALSNLGAGILTGTVSSDSSWLTVSQGDFTGNVIIINVTVNTSGQQNGDYTGTITINSNGGSATVTVKVKATCVLVYPNPYPLSAGKLLTFWGSGVVPNDTKIRIYTLGGDLVKTITETVGEKLFWNGTNDNGDRVVPGIYLYVSESPKEVSTGRITVIK